MSVRFRVCQWDTSPRVSMYGTEEECVCDNTLRYIVAYAPLSFCD